MDGQLFVSLIVSVIALLGLMLPFFFGEGGHLVTAASINSEDVLVKMRQEILERYIEDEKAFHDKLISKASWQQRQRFLTLRYLDISRRLDYIKKAGSL